ncbi:hypothetical protein G114_05025 [Aeromonas diversa CDC 2478-85]|uniref:Uncharacterized protein n=1 Tax=Aeromonas diversa CDC 2478-85 TaxID=1268237 RepID=N9VCG3_9GAMM|nr:hypothetical protein [Aeromonas diversa]ENY72932.1 hypothetical protein G114_05025 [Aeromonas diversa CDC 2478-85]
MLSLARPRLSAGRWIPLWCLLLVLMSFGTRAATDLCTFTSHCGSMERHLEKAMPCGSFTTALGMAVVADARLGVACLAPDRPCFPEPNRFVPVAPVERLERPPILIV